MTHHHGFSGTNAHFGSALAYKNFRFARYMLVKLQSNDMFAWQSDRHGKNRRMPKITFVQPDGSQKTVEAKTGATVMETAKTNLIDGVEAECGGACACATCHVYVAEEWIGKTGNPSEMEEDMLDYAFDVVETSRLSCQIKTTEELDGLVVKVPDKQF